LASEELKKAPVQRKAETGPAPKGTNASEGARGPARAPAPSPTTAKGNTRVTSPAGTGSRASQQAAGQRSSFNRANKMPIGMPVGRFEREAEAAASDVVAGRSLSRRAISQLGELAIQRYSWDDFVSDLERAANAVADTAGKAADTVGGVAREVWDIAQGFASALGGTLSFLGGVLRTYAPPLDICRGRPLVPVQPSGNRSGFPLRSPPHPAWTCCHLRHARRAHGCHAGDISSARPMSRRGFAEGRR
jgi:hypothetical protein